MFACTTFRVGGMQLSQLFYITGANLTLSRRVKMAFIFCCGKSWRRVETQTSFVEPELAGMSLEKVLLGVILV